MKSLFLKILQFIARLIPLGVYSSRLRREPIDFFYHAVSDEPMEHARWLYSVVPVAQFDAALQYIRTTYTPVDYHQLHAHCTQGQPLPTNAAHISFDDGFRECFSIARPLLLDYEIPCTFFVATDWIDNRAMFYRNKISLCVERLHVTPSDRSNLAALTSDATTPDAVIHWLKQLRLPDEPLIDEI